MGGFTQVNWSVLHAVELGKAVEYDQLRRLLDFARQKELVDDEVNLVEVENEVELADVVEVVVEHLHEEVDRLERRELVVIHVHA